MPTHLVNLDALITREDFEAADNTEGGLGNQPSFKVEELQPGRMYFKLLRKPDFQRPTNNWKPEMIVEFVQSILDAEVTPALILWHSKKSGKVFVIDGAHRLSALMAWVNDDYGYGDISREFRRDIPEAQIAFHNKTKALMDARIGTFKELYRMGMNPLATDDHDKVRRGRATATIFPPIQVVLGSASVAETSFLKINGNPATIDPTDLDVIRARRKPNAIAARAMMRAGIGYWAKLEKAAEIEQLADEVYDLIFGKIVEINSQSPDIPRAGQPYSHEAFEMVLDMVNIFNDVTPAMWQEQKPAKRRKRKVNVAVLPDDTDGTTTILYLEKIKEVGMLAHDNGSKNSGALGLDPSVYSYGATGKFNRTAFIASLKFAQELKAKDDMFAFTRVRNEFEEFLVAHDFFLNQLGHSKGGRLRPLEAIVAMHRKVFECIKDGISDHATIVRRLQEDERFKDLNDVSNIPVDDTKRKRFSKKVQDAGIVREIRNTRARCTECGARLPPVSRSKDHKTRVMDGGKGTLDNLQFTHPYCNTGYKERKNAMAQKTS